MPKPDPVLLDPANYPFRCEIQPRYTDVDTNYHINNVALVDILQEGRIRFHNVSGYDRAVDGIASMTVSLSVDYLGQALFPAPLQNYIGASAVGRTSHTLAQLVMQDGAIIAHARTVLVCVKDGKPVANPKSFHETIAEWMLRA